MFHFCLFTTLFNYFTDLFIDSDLKTNQNRLSFSMDNIAQCYRHFIIFCAQNLNILKLLQKRAQGSTQNTIGFANQYF